MGFRVGVSLVFASSLASVLALGVAGLWLEKRGTFRDARSSLGWIEALSEWPVPKSKVSPSSYEAPGVVPASASRAEPRRPSPWEMETPETRQLYLRAMQFFYTRKTRARGVALLERMIELNPNSVLARQELCQVYLENGNALRARDCAAECLRLQSNNVPCHETRVMTFWSEGDYEHLGDSIDDCLDAEPSNGRCLLARFEQTMERADFASAQTLLARLRKEAPGSAWTVIAAAIFAEHEGDLATARRLYHTACARGDRLSCAKEAQL